MRKELFVAALAAFSAGRAFGQDYDPQGGYVGQDFSGPGSVGSQEQLFPYDDQEPWKHGYRQVMPYYGGWHSFRPYNYHHVFGQTRTAQQWGMQQPYSQQFWHRYQAIPGENVVPFPQPNAGAPQLMPQQFAPTQQQYAPAGQQAAPTQGYYPQAVEQPAGFDPYAQPSTSYSEAGGNSYYAPPAPPSLPAPSY
jgi:hypothetical protein